MVKDIDALWDVAFVICMIYEVWEIWRLKIVKCEIITAGEVVEIAFQEESFVREEYEDVFIGNKIVKFQSEGVWEWSLKELWCVICNGVVSVYDIV